MLNTSDGDESVICRAVKAAVEEIETSVRIGRINSMLRNKPLLEAPP